MQIGDWARRAQNSKTPASWRCSLLVAETLFHLNLLLVRPPSSGADVRVTPKHPLSADLVWSRDVDATGPMWKGERILALTNPEWHAYVNARHSRRVRAELSVAQLPEPRVGLRSLEASSMSWRRGERRGSYRVISLQLEGSRATCGHERARLMPIECSCAGHAASGAQLSVCAISSLAITADARTRISFTAGSGRMVA